MSTDLGDLTGLGIALGLLQPNGTPQEGWFANPTQRLRTILTDDDQREALLETADDLLGGSEATHDDQGRTWLPVFENAGDDAATVAEQRGGVKAQATAYAAGSNGLTP